LIDCQSPQLNNDPAPVSALRTEEYFAERAAKGVIKKAFQVLKRAGKGHPPIAGDELPLKRTRRRRLAHPQ
jgi:hypothetical protein